MTTDAHVSTGRSGDVELHPRSNVNEFLKRLRVDVPRATFRRRGRSVSMSIADAATLLDEVGMLLDWDPDARLAVEGRRRVASAHASVMRSVRCVRSAAVGELRDNLRSNLDWVDTLDGHQVRNVSIMTIRDGWGACVFDEQGTGKTPTTLAAFDVLVDRDEADVLFVVAPKSMVGEWVNEVRTFTAGRYRAVQLAGTTREKVRTLHSRAEVIVTNYETVVTMLATLKPFCGEARVVLAVDESFNVKNPSAVRTDAVRTLRDHCARAFVLCGTPAPNRASDIVAQADLVDHGYAFAMPYNADDPDEIRSVLQSRVVYTRNLKRAVLPDLPNRTFTEVRIDLAPEQRKAYAAALNDLIIDLSDCADAEFGRRLNSYLERRSALIRLCSNPFPLIAGYNETPSKLATLDDLVPRLLADPAEKIVIWSFYRHSLRTLVERYSSFGVVHIDGDVSSDDRRSAVSRFQAERGPRIFVGNPAAAGAGITLHRARTAIYESLSNQAAHYLQSLDRIHRRGQERPVEYVALVAAGTIEEDEYSRLRTKAQSQADLLGDPIDERITRSVLLAELLASRDRLKD